MQRIISILSLLHEPADRSSAVRLFRGKPVLDWTLRKVSAAASIDTVALLCWDDQAAAVNPIAERRNAGVISKGARQNLPRMNAITTARRWADGWRSGLLGTCEFDLGFQPAWINELIQLHEADAVVLVDPAAGLLDPVLVETLVEYADTQPDAELCFMQAAPGLTGTLFRRELIERLSIANLHPGRLLTYFPEQYGVDPVGKPGCVPVPAPVARSIYRFKLDSDRQIARADHATVHLNGHLVSTQAEELAISMRGCEVADRLPREVVLELSTRRATSPQYWPGKYLQIDRPEMTLAIAEKLFTELSLLDDIRLTLAGVGDPLLSPVCFQIIAAAKAAGISAIGIETDLVSIAPDDLHRLATSGIDVISVHFPAATATTYAPLMGVDGFSRVYHNLGQLEEQIRTANMGTPLICPIFTKTAANLAEMELWYDYWVQRLGHAVIVGPSDFAGQIPDLAVADMASPNRRPCARLANRMTVLSSGQIVSCEQDILGNQSVGMIGEMPIQEIWQKRFAPLRKDHQSGEWNTQPLCGKCREWHRA
jgi:hypothetical protein